MTPLRFAVVGAYLFGAIAAAVAGWPTALIVAGVAAAVALTGRLFVRRHHHLGDCPGCPACDAYIRGTL